MRERVRVGQRGHHRLLDDGLDLQFRPRARHADEPDVEPAVLELAQLLAGAELVQAQRDVRRVVAERAQQLGHERVHRRADEADRQPADLAALDAPGLARCVLDRVEDLPRPDEERLAGGRQLDPALVAQQQRRPDLLLELADLLAQRRLRHVQALGRAAEVQLLGDDDEVAQVAELHGQS